MKDFQTGNPDFNDIVFRNRNRGYGAYVLRKKYNGIVIISILLGSLIMATATITPYLNALARQNMKSHAERKVEIRMEQLDQPVEQIVIPPPPPPPESDAVQQQKYVPPQVVDSVNTEEANQLMTTDQAHMEVTNKGAVEEVLQAKEELPEVMSEPEPFLTVEEMPEPPGGMAGLYKFIAENTHYPEIAAENNIQGKVFVRFCVTSRGNIEQINLFKGVDPSLDAEALRVVKTFPQFKPGKQAGIPVPVWFTVYINFQLK